MIEILWNQLIFNKFNKNIKIDKNSIKKELANLNIQTEYLISEIVFELKSGETLDKKFKIIKNKIEQKILAKLHQFTVFQIHQILVVS